LWEPTGSGSRSLEAQVRQQAESLIEALRAVGDSFAKIDCGLERLDRSTKPP